MSRQRCPALEADDDSVKDVFHKWRLPAKTKPKHEDITVGLEGRNLRSRHRSVSKEGKKLPSINEEGVARSETEIWNENPQMVDADKVDPHLVDDNDPFEEEIDEDDDYFPEGDDESGREDERRLQSDCTRKS